MRAAVCAVAGAVAATGAYLALVSRRWRAAESAWKMPSREDRRRFVVALAMTASSGHNMQPWRVRLDEDNARGLTVCVDPKGLCCAVDPYCRQTCHSFGCFLETLKIAATKLGMRAIITLFPDGVAGVEEVLDDRPIARVRLAVDLAGDVDPLFKHVLRRRTCKGKFAAAPPVTKDQYAALAKCIVDIEGVRVRIGPRDAEWARKVSALVVEASRIENTNPRAVDELLHSMCLGSKEAASIRRGLCFRGPLFEFLGLLGGSLGRSIVRRVIMGDPVSKDDRDVIDSQHAVLWLEAPENRVSQVRLGQAWCRLSLQCMELGLGLHPYTQATEEYPEMAAVCESLQQLLSESGAAPGAQVQMLGTLGPAPTLSAQPPQPRVSLDSILV